jgi:hypothetical protein
MKREDVIKTFKTLIANHPGLASVDVVRVTNEFEELLNVGLIKPVNRRMLLEIVHSCRALESIIDVLFQNSGIIIPDKNKSLGKFLIILNSKKVVTSGMLVDKIDKHSKDRYQELVTNVRNNIMHRADAYPASEKELDGFLSVLNAWLSHILALT